MKKLLAGGTLAVLAFGGMIAGAAPASAHTPEVNADCGWVDVSLRAYQQAKVTVVIDDKIAYEAEFSGQFAQKFDGLALDAPHEWTVTVDAYDGQDGVQFDWSESGSIEPCVEATPTPEPTPSEPPVTEPEPSEEPTVEPTVEPTDEASAAPIAEPSEEPSASPTPAAEEPPVLAATGATVGGAIAFAALLAAGGVALVWARKRMQNA
ncbi:PT domain-containing protein [Promicromonospora sp. NPDC023987]|uniref:PT domain-containing protein n=1 Tax=Promicromonospora sp. NPDC023987 TaxID=3155360 RepID=UPI0033C7D9C2